MTKTRIVMLAAGALGGYASFKLAQAARWYCGSYEIDESLFNAERAFEPVISVLVGVVIALIASVSTGSDTWPRRVAPYVLLLLLLGVMVWVQMAWLGTPFGGTSDSGRCPYSNVPPWWPHWIPA